MRLRRTDPHTLAGAYALDALSEEDRERFERHLGVCESCRAEAASLRDAAGRLAEATAAAPPPRLRGLVLAEAARTRQQPPPVRVAERVRRSWHGVGWPAAPRLAVAIAGVGILVALALGTLLINDQHRLHMDEAQRSQIAAVLNAPDADIMTVSARTHGSARRTCAVMVSRVLVRVTSVSSRRAMRLRSRAGVAGSFQMPGRSVTSWLIRVFWASVSCPLCCLRAWS